MIFEKTLKDGSVLFVRFAKPSDAKQLLDYMDKMVKESSFTTFAEGEWDVTVEEEEKYIQSLSGKVNCALFVAEIEGNIVGTLSLSGVDRIRIRHYAELGISVGKSHWGKGVGTFLIESAHQWAYQQGIIKKIELRVTATNERALALYKKLGYVQEGYTTKDMFIEGVYEDSYLMGLWLGDEE